ncbi:SDR family oxidoreductase [Ramlibacter sp. GCM10027632]
MLSAVAATLEAAGPLRAGNTAVITGAGSGLGLELARLAARHGLRLVLADVQQDALDRCAEAMRAAGCEVLARRVDVSDAADMQALADAAFERFGAPNLVFNNAGVAFSGLVWEASAADWEWVLGVNLRGVVHGVRLFTPMMLAAARRDPAWRGRIVNTASMAGLVTPPNLGLYNVSKHAVVALSETLHHDLSLVTDQVRASVLCPYFFPTGIHQSQRNRADAPAAPPTASQRVGQAMFDSAVQGGQVSAAEVAQRAFEAVAQDRFHVFSHPGLLQPVADRAEALVAGRNPPDPFAARPEVGARLRAALRGAE